MTFTGYAGVLLGDLAAAYLSGWRRGLFLPVALAAGIVMTALCVLELVAGRRWARAALLLLLTAVPTALVAARRPRRTAGGAAHGDRLPGRRGAAGAARGLLDARPAAVLLTFLRRRDGGGLGPRRGRPEGDVAGGRGCRAGRGAPARRRPAGTLALAVVLAVQGGCTLGWAWRTGRRHRTADGDEASRAAWRAGAAQLVFAAWVAAATAGWPPSSGTPCPPRPGCCSGRVPVSGTARPGPPGGRACWWPPCRRRSWRSRPRTGRGRSGCWSPRLRSWWPVRGRASARR